MFVITHFFTLSKCKLKSWYLFLFTHCFDFIFLGHEGETIFRGIFVRRYLDGDRLMLKWLVSWRPWQLGLRRFMVFLKMNLKWDSFGDCLKNKIKKKKLMSWNLTQAESFAKAKWQHNNHDQVTKCNKSSEVDIHE